MSKTLLIFIDVQQVFARTNSVTVQRIAATAETVRGSIPLLWVFSDWIDVPEPVQLKNLGQPDYNYDPAMHPVIRPGLEDWIVSKKFNNAFYNEQLVNFVAEHEFNKIIIAGFEADLCAFSSAVHAKELPGIDSVEVLLGLTTQGLNDWGMPPETRRAYKNHGIKIVTTLDAFGIDMPGYKFEGGPNYDLG